MKRTHLLVAFFSLFIAIRAFALPVTACEEHHCLGVVDAGSNGSRLFVYAYDLDAYQNPINVNEVIKNKVTPGLATIESNDDEISHYLDRLFDVPLPSMKAIPVHFYATAGMRLLPEDTQQHHYKLLSQWFKKHPSWDLKTAKTIPGKDEGIYGWLAVNYKTGRLYEPQKPLNALIEVGGASAQLVFPLKEGEATPDTATLDNHYHHTQLFSHSFLGLGVNEVRKQHEQLAACFPKEMPLDNNTGDGNAYLCAALLANNIFHQLNIHEVFYKPLKRHTSNEWFVGGAINALLKDQPFVLKQEQFQPFEILTQAHNKLCQQTPEHLLHKYPNNTYILNNCLATSYYYALLVNIFHFSPLDTLHVPLADSISWTLGVVLNQSSQVSLPQDSVSRS